MPVPIESAFRWSECKQNANKVAFALSKPAAQVFIVLCSAGGISVVAMHHSAGCSEAMPSSSTEHSRCPRARCDMQLLATSVRTCVHVMSATV